MQTTNYLYRPVVAKAWEVTKKFKTLWVLGLFAVLVSAGGEYEIITSAFNNDASDTFIGSLIVSFQSGWSEGSALLQGDFWGNLSQLITSNIGGLLMSLFVFLLIIAIALCVIWLAVASQIALIKNAALAIKNKKSTLASGYAFAHANFWPVLGITAILKIVLFALVSLLAWEFWSLTSWGLAGDLIYICSFLIFVAATIVISFILKYQIFYLVLKKQKFAKAFNSAVDLFKNNWLISLEMGGIMFGFYIAATSVSILLLSIFAGIPLIIVPFYLTAIPVLIKMIVSVLAFLLAMATVLLVSAMITVFQWSGWVALFDRLEGTDETVSKLERVTQSVMNIPAALRERVN